MQISKDLLAFAAMAALIGTIVFTTAVPDIYAQTQDAKKRSYSVSDSKEPQDNSAIHWVSTDESANEYTASFRIEDCTFNSTGRNPFFVLEPNYQLVLAGEEAGEKVELTVTVLNETREINGTETRVIEERETLDSELVEVSRNYFAICEETNSVFYFGEEVDIYENGRIVSHEGAWIAGENDNRAGIIMPGTILLGARYYQEIAPNVALDRAEIENMGEIVQTLAGNFSDTVITRETTPLEPDLVELKNYAAGIGLVQEEEIKLEQYGFIE